MITGRFCDSIVEEAHYTACVWACTVRVCGWLYASNANSHGWVSSAWALCASILYVFCEWSVFSLCSRRRSAWVCTRVCVCVCFPFNTISALLSIACDCELRRQQCTLTFGRPPSTAQCRLFIWHCVLWYCGWWLGDYLQLGFPGSCPCADQAVWWSTEPLQPVRGDALDVHDHCCTADRLSCTRAVNRQYVTQPQTA